MCRVHVYLGARVPTTECLSLVLRLLILTSERKTIQRFLYCQLIIEAGWQEMVLVVDKNSVLTFDISNKHAA